MEDGSPQKLFLIQDLETLRTVADPLRAQIYEILTPEPATVKEIAARLGTVPSRLYYHVNIMEKQGLLKVVETRMVANMVEKVYRAAAYELEVAPELLNFRTDEGKQALGEALTSPLDATRDDLLRSVQARLFDMERGEPDEKRQRITVNRSTARVPEAYAEEFTTRLRALIEEFSAQEAGGAAAGGAGGDKRQMYALTIAFYPSFYYGED